MALMGGASLSAGSLFRRVVRRGWFVGAPRVLSPSQGGLVGGRLPRLQPVAGLAGGGMGAPRSEGTNGPRDGSRGTRAAHCEPLAKRQASSREDQTDCEPRPSSFSFGILGAIIFGPSPWPRPVGKQFVKQGYPPQKRRPRKVLVGIPVVQSRRRPLAPQACLEGCDELPEGRAGVPRVATLGRGLVLDRSMLLTAEDGACAANATGSDEAVSVDSSVEHQ